MTAERAGPPVEGSELGIDYLRLTRIEGMDPMIAPTECPTEKVSVLPILSSIAQQR